MQPTVTKPFPNSYHVPGSRLIAGEYPFSPTRAEGLAKLRQVLDAGATVFIDLTAAAEPLEKYADALHEEAARHSVEVEYHRLPIADNDIPAPERMAEILDRIAAAESAGRVVYLHCWGGVGRTGTVVGCYLARGGASGEQALEQVTALFGGMSEAKRRKHAHTGSPQTGAQRDFVLSWRARDPEVRVAPATEAGAETKRRLRELEAREPADAGLITSNEETAPDEEDDGPDINALLRRLEQDIPNQPAPLLPIVCRALEEEGLTYSLDESSSSVALAIRGDEAEFSCFLRANDAFRMVVCLVRPPVWVPEGARTLMCEAITLANYNLPFGNFEMDLEDGDLRFKTSIDVEGGELVTKMVQNLLGAGIAKANQYHPAFMRVMYGGVPPRDAIAEVEE